MEGNLALVQVEEVLGVDLGAILASSVDLEPAHRVEDGELLGSAGRQLRVVGVLGRDVGEDDLGRREEMENTQ